MLNIGILKCGSAIEANDLKYRDLMRLTNPDVTIKTFECINYEFPTETDHKELDGYIVTGSVSSAYNTDPWIIELKDLIRELDNMKIKLVGLCFGHQIIALALGGEVENNPLGWEASVCTFGLNSLGQELFPNKSKLSIQFIHHDIVTDPGPLECIGGNDICKYQGLIKDNHIFTLQGHPEYTPEVVEIFLDTHAPIFISEEQIQECRKHLHDPTDSVTISKFIVDFFSK